MSEEQQARIISPVHDPYNEGFSDSRKAAMIIEFIVTIPICGTLFLFTSRSHQYLSWIFLLFAAFSFIIYMVFARDEKTLSYNLGKLGFEYRKKTGKEDLSKFNPKTTEEQLKNNIPVDSVNEKTGLCKCIHPNSKDYFGNWICTFLVIPPVEVDKKTMDLKFKKIDKALLKRCASRKIIMMIGLNPSFILNDIDELLKDPNLSAVRNAELLSMKKKFMQQTGTIERTYYISFSFPFTQHEEKAQQSMNRLLKGYMRLLNKMKCHYILIREEQDYVDIYRGMLTGKKIHGVV
jgi:hypothetical protein